MLRTSGTYTNNAPTAAGQTLHGDHLYAFYQVPQDPKTQPIVMLHGAYQSARSWETTPDGREGFQNIFLRRRFPVYLVDQPRRGRAGNSTVATTIEPTPYDQLFFDGTYGSSVLTGTSLNKSIFRGIPSCRTGAPGSEFLILSFSTLVKLPIT